MRSPSPTILENHPVPIAGILALITLPVHLLLPIAISHLLAAGVLALIGGVYIGFAAIDGRTSRIILETCVGLAFAVFAMVSLQIEPLWLAAGYVFHGLWDALHHSPWFDVKMPKWYIPLCAAYDIAAGIGLFIIWSV